MERWSIAHWTSCDLAAGAVLLMAYLWVRERRRLRGHDDFLTYCSIATVSLQVAPARSLIQDSLFAAAFARDYAVMQALSLLFSQLPLVAFDFRRAGAAAGGRPRIHADDPRSSLVRGRIR